MPVHNQLLSASFVEKAILPPLTYFRTFVKNLLGTFELVCVFVSCAVHLSVL